jgi:recombination protein RecA
MAVKAVAGAATSTMDKLREMIVKAIPDDKPIVDIDPDSLMEPLPHIKSGSVVLDYLIGGKLNRNGVQPCPGLPKGKIINVYGANSCGKTTMALTAAAKVCQAGGTVVYIDWENEIVPDYAAALGVPIGDKQRFMLCQPDTLEDGFKIMFGAAGLGVDLIVVDSVGAGVPKATRMKTLEEMTDTPRIGMVAQSWSQFLPNLKGQVARHGTVVIGIAQVRKNIAVKGYGDDTTVQGGEAWKFFSAVRIKLARIGYEKLKIVNPVTNKTEDSVGGAVIKAKLDKNKVASSQGCEQTFYIRWGTGIDDIRSIIDIAVSHNIVKKGGAWYTWVKPNGESQRFQGMTQVWDYFAAAPNLFEMLYQQTLPKLGQAASYVKTDNLAEDSSDEDSDLMADMLSIGQDPLVIPTESTFDEDN